MTAAKQPQPVAKSPRRAVAAADRTRQPTEVRRRLIVEAAVPLIAERGYASVGVRDVAAAAGVSVGTVTYHFGSVQEILSEAMVLHIERYYAELSEAAEQATSGAEALRLLVDALFTEDTDRHWRMWFDYWNSRRTGHRRGLQRRTGPSLRDLAPADPRTGPTGRHRRRVRRRRPRRLHRPLRRPRRRPRPATAAPGTSVEH